MAPVGYRFVPTEEELLTILKNRSTGIPPPYRVVEKNLYGVDSTPWKLFDDTAAWEAVVDSSSCKVSPTASVIYAITKLSNVGNGGKNRNRTAGCGTWHGSSKAKSIKNWMGQEIGTMRTLNFVSKTEMRGNWIMHEYALSGILLGSGTNNDYVICRITRRVDEPEAKFQGCEKRQAVLDGGNQENQGPAFSNDQESQHSGSTEREQGEELHRWFMDSITVEEIGHAANFQEEAGGAANFQDIPVTVEEAGGAANFESDAVDYDSMTELVADYLFSDEYSKGYQFPAEVVDNYLVSCLD